MNRTAYLFCALALFLISGCGLLVEEGREVLAEVGGEPIRQNDLLRRIRELPFEERAKTNAADKTARLEARRHILKMLVAEKLLAEEAAARGMAVSDEEAEAAIIRSRQAEQSKMGNIAEGMKGASSGHEHGHGDEKPSRSEIEEAVEKMMIEKLLSERLSDSAVRKYYDEHVQEFVVSPPLLNYELVVVDVANRKFIDTLYQKATKERTTLAAALGSFKNPPPIVFAGMTPMVALDGLVPTMREKVETLKVGEVSKPFSLRQGNKDQIAIARLASYLDSMPFDHMKGSIRQKLYQDFLAEMEKKHKVIYHEDKLDYQLKE
ncbi:MAG: SurA N-terminal domain-containing protein [Candidatus Lindowbacteria bacterium]|nr:SurA N-terminal domain-containing protein [Candidatus Lindowbacteria bacterium]